MRQLSVVSFLLVLLACGGRPAGKMLTYYFSSEPRSLDPALSTDVPTGEMVAMLFDNLVQVTAGGTLTPGLAARWEIDPAGVHYTFHLRAGATFHDGRPIRSADVRASFERVLAPGSGPIGRQWPLAPIAGAKAFAEGRAAAVTGIATPDDSTVVLTLAEPLNHFLKLLAMPVAAIVPTPTDSAFGQHPTGSGPWRFVSWRHDDEILLARNPAYWGRVPASDSLRIRIIPEPLTQAAEYDAGRLSVVEVPFGETRRWETGHAAELQRRTVLRVVYVALNTRRGPLRDVRVRQALNYAVDIDAILQTVIGGRGVRAAGAIPPGLDGYDSTRAPYPHDPARARRMLAEAGYPAGVSLTLWRSARPVYARVAQAIQADLAAIGVPVTIVERDASAARLAARNGETDLFLTDWYGDYPDAENFLFPLFWSGNAGSGGNLAFLADTALDREILAARATPDSADKVQRSRAIDARIHGLAPWIFGWFPVEVWAMRPDVTGWQIPALFNGQRWQEARVLP